MAKKITKKTLKKNVAPAKMLGKVVNVKNAEGEADTKATILIQNKINYIPKVSVIIPVYNVADYLRECLDSVINQTLKEIEVICVDDGSTDNSLDILKEYAKKDNRITVMRQENLHAGVARNAGLAVAKGEYLSFLDSDDFFELDMLEECVVRLEKDKTEICIFSADKIDYLDGSVKAMPWVLNTKKDVLNVSEEKGSLFRITSPNCWNKIFKRNLLEKYNLRFQGLVNANDVYFSYLAVLLSNKISVINKVFLHYRYNTGKQITSGLSKSSPLNIYNALWLLKKHVLRYLDETYLADGFYIRCVESMMYQKKMSPSNFVQNLPVYQTLFSDNYMYLFKKYFSAVPIVFAANDNYAKYLAVTVLSVLDSIGLGSVCKFYVLCDRLSDENKDKLRSIIKSPATIDFINVSDYIKGIDLYESDYFTREMYYRFLIPQIFADFEKVLYLDCDMIVKDDVSKLFEIDLGQNVIAAVKDLCAKNKRNIIRDRLKIEPKDYFNSGFILFNVKQWNKFGLTKKSLDLVAKYPKLSTPDQDILNMVCNGHVLYLERAWNYVWHYLFINRDKYNELDVEARKDYEKAFDSVKIIHYTSSTKPWNCKKERLADVWWQYAKKVPFYEEICGEYKEVIVSLTSFPARIGTVNQTIESLLNQTRKADEVILWLAPEQFPNKEADLPKQLLDLKSKGLTIDWYHDIRSYKKLIPTLKKYPDAIIVTADDDNIYAPDWLSKLYDSFSKYPNDIQCHRVTKFFYTDSGFHTIPGGREYYKGANYLNKLVGLGGVLYPPHCFYKDILDEKLIKELAPTNDDQWFWIQAALNGVKVRVVANPNIAANYVPGTQESGLTNINDKGQKLFWKDFNRLMNYYPEVKQLFIRESKKNGECLTWEDPLKTDLERWYKRVSGKTLNLDNPRTFNEKIQWLKLYNSTPVKTRLADKYLVRDWVKEKIGEQYLIPLLGVYDKFEDIDFSKLPNRFVIKCNHGCGYNIIVKDKSKLDLQDVKAKLDKWMHENFAFKVGFELQYRDIEPKILIEKYVENGKSGGDLYDYKFWCFDGKVKFIQFLSERNLDGLKMAFYDKNWKKQNFVYSYPLDRKNIEKPDNLDEMISLAEKLSDGFNHVRVDFYRLDDGTIYFGEMTFTSASGLCKWNDEKINNYFGNLIKLPKHAYNIDTGEYYKLSKKSKFMAYALFPYYLWKLISKKKQYKKAVARNITKQLQTLRIDIKNNGGTDNNVEVASTSNVKVSKPAWFKNAQGQGAVLESCDSKLHIKITAVKDGTLSLVFKAPDRRFEGKRFPVYAKYTSIKVDGHELLSMPVSVWHDAPFKYEMHVKHGQVVDVIISQEPHKYKKSELKELLLKLGKASDAYTCGRLKQFIDGDNKFFKHTNDYKNLYTWDYIRNTVLTAPAKEVELNNFDMDMAGRLLINVDKTKFETCLIPSNKKKLYVFLSAWGKFDTIYPGFTRISWADKLDGMCLYVDDPTRVEQKYAPAFFFGSKYDNYLDKVYRIVKKIQKIHRIAFKDVVFISSSNGGFASIYLANKLSGSKCIALCPQVDALVYSNGKIATKFGISSFELSWPLFSKRLNVLDFLNNRKSKFFIYSNLACDSDACQMRLLLDKARRPIRTGLFDLNRNVRVLLVDIDSLEPHLVQPNYDFIAFIENFMNLPISAKLKEQCDALIDIMRVQENRKLFKADQEQQNEWLSSLQKSLQGIVKSQDMINMSQSVQKAVKDLENVLENQTKILQGALSSVAQKTSENIGEISKSLGTAKQSVNYMLQDAANKISVGIADNLTAIKSSKKDIAGLSQKLNGFFQDNVDCAKKLENALENQTKILQNNFDAVTQNFAENISELSKCLNNAVKSTEDSVTKRIQAISQVLADNLTRLKSSEDISVLDENSEYIRYKKYNDIAYDIKNNIEKIPSDIDLVVGVPRSGMIPAYIIGLALNRKVCSVNEFLNGGLGNAGFTRKINSGSKIKKVLIVDDTVNTGLSMAKIKEQLQPLADKYQFVFMAVYTAGETASAHVDLALKLLPQPRMFQWNYLYHSFMKNACYDMDGVLCVDPTDAENDDGPNYLQFIKNAKPLYVPNGPIGYIVTSRLEKYRKETEQWLADHGIQYKKLYMYNGTAEERKKLGLHADFKAEIYKSLTDTRVFIESNPAQAKKIAMLSKKDVICCLNDTLYRI